MPAKLRLLLRKIVSQFALADLFFTCAWFPDNHFYSRLSHHRHPSQDRGEKIL
jgi:hypothetical protein